MPDVTVRLSVADNFSASLRKFADEIDTASGSTKRFAEETKKTTNPLTELNSAINLSQQALGAIQGAMAQTVGVVVEYAKQVRDLSRTIGASAEDSSKLIQAADDVGVSYGSLTAALQAAIRKGVEPSIDGIGKLADQYNRIQDPIARTKFLMDNFGRSGAELAPLMEQGAAGIREMGLAAEEAGLVLDQEAVVAARNYEIAMDDLDDSIMGVKIILAQELIPALAETASEMAKFVTTTRQLQESFNPTSLLSWAEAARGLALSIAPAIGFGDNLVETLNRIRGVTEGTTGEIDRQRDALKFNADAVTAYGDRWKGLADTFPSLETPMGQVSELSDATYTLADSIQTVMDKQDAWTDKAGGDFQTALEAAGLKGKDLETALLAVDSVMGTSLVQQQQYRERVQAITDEFAKTGRVSDFIKALNDLKTQMMPQIERNDAYTKSLGGLRGELEKLTKQPWEIVISFRQEGTAPMGLYQGPPLNTAPGGGGSGGPGQPNQYGADFTVPAGFTNDTFPMRVSSGEHVTVTPQFGGGPAAGGAISATFYITEAANPEATARMVIQHLEDLDRARKG